MAETPVERANRLAATAPAKLGDQVLVSATLHRYERSSYHLANWLQTLCGQAVSYQAPDDGKYIECPDCETLWRIKRELLKLQALARQK